MAASALNKRREGTHAACRLSSSAFGALAPRYLIRSYIIGIGLFSGLTWFMFAGNSTGLLDQWPSLVYGVICTALYPFAKLVWEELCAMLLGNTVITMNAFLLLLFKLVVAVTIWGFAIFIAPFGLLYLWLRTGAQTARFSNGVIVIKQQVGDALGEVTVRLGQPSALRMALEQSKLDRILQAAHRPRQAGWPTPSRRAALRKLG